MNQLEKLVQFLNENVPEWVMQKTNLYMDDGKLSRDSKALGLDQRRFGIFKYTAILDWDSFPYKEYPPANIYAMILGWLDEHGNELRDELNLADPDVDINFDEEYTSPMVISIELAESINGVPDENGDILYRGQRWKLDNPETYTAIFGTLHSIDKSGAPL
ncbi:phage tail protein [Providencia sp.]|uniref:phage tail protein n=1 Tax=Providencia sp. TaxID=589 RepID=UPI00333E8399